MPRGKPNTCKVCEHPQSDTIRRLAISGSKSQVHRQYGLAMNTISKCIENHNAEELRQSVGLTLITDKPSGAELSQAKEYSHNKITALVTKEGWTEEVQNYMNQIEGELIKLQEAGQIHHFTQLSHVKTKLLELAGKAAGVFAPDTAVQINNFIDSEDYKKLKQLIIQTLVPYPEALAAVGQAIKQSGL